jgi:hypothetical protein
MALGIMNQSSYTLRLLRNLNSVHETLILSPSRKVCFYAVDTADDFGSGRGSLANGLSAVGKCIPRVTSLGRHVLCWMHN